MLRVKCDYSFTETNRVKLVADNFDRDIGQNEFFTLRIPGFTSPRSTAETDSFEFQSFDASDRLLDQQTKGLTMQAEDFNEIKTMTFESDSQIVGIGNANLTVTFQTLDDLTDTDWLQLQIPKWNKGSSYPLPIISYDQESLKCTGLVNTRQEEVNCFLIPGRLFDVVKIVSPLKKTVFTQEEIALAEQNQAELATDVIEAGQTISFKIGPIRNPISTAPIEGFELQTLSQRQGKIGVGLGELKVSASAVIANDSDSVSLTASKTLINSLSTFLIELTVPLPLDAGCQIDLFIPKPLVIGESLTRVMISGMFGSLREADITIDASRNLIKIDNACMSYRQNVAKASFELDSLVNPGYVITSDSFYIEIADVNGNQIVRTSGGLTQTTKPGKIFVQPWYASNLLVSAFSEITFSVQPLHPTPTRDVKVKLYLPREDFKEIPEDTCLVKYHNQVDADKVVCESDRSEHSITLTQKLADPYLFKAFHYIEFSVDAIKMPSSTRPTGAFKIEFLADIDGIFRLVDTMTVKNRLRAIAGGLQQVNVVPKYGTTFTKDTMAISFKADHTVLQGGSILVSIPPELYFTKDAQCMSYSANIETQATCTFQKDQGSVTLHDGFDVASFDELAEPLVIEIEGIFTPRSVMPTTNFNITTFDSLGYAIDFHDTYFLPPLTDAEQISEMRVVQSDREVGQSTVYDLLMKSPYPLMNGDQLTVTVPDQAAIDLASSFSYCKGSSEQIYLAESLPAQIQGLNNILITLRISENLTEIPIGAEFGIQLAFLKNPESTKPSDPFRVSITDQRKNLVTKLTDDKEKLSTFVMQATEPSSIVFGQVNNEPKYAKEPTLIQMELITKHLLPQNSILQVKVPSQLTLPAEEDMDQLKCWIDSSPIGDVQCDFDEELYMFTLRNINPYGDVRGGSRLQIELKGLRNDETAQVTDSFEALTLTSEGFMIDRLTSGMTVASNCDWPCWECPVGQPQQCLKCDTREDAIYPLFFYNGGEGKCLNDCPSHFFEMNNVCQECDSSCLECTETSTKCMECYSGEFLLGNQCLEICPNTHHGIMESKTCEQCESPCKTCENSLTRCTSCDQSLDTIYFFRNECFEQCPIDISVQDEGECVECSSNCKTCDSLYDAGHCTSCYGDSFLDYFTNTCVEECPAGLTVANANALTLKGQTNTCDLCNENCLTCSDKDTEICLECRSGLKMLETEKKCLTQCPKGTAEVWIPLVEDTVCAECAPGCTECENSREHCTVCKDDFFFFDFSCVTQCPTEYSVISDEIRTCVREREFCPYGQRYNKFGQCELYLAECKVGYVLNSSETECIPEPGFHLPFAFLYAAAGWTLYILRKKNRDKMQREMLISQLLLGFTILQQFSYIVQLCLAYTMGFDFIVAMHTVAMFLHYFFNLLCLVAVHWLIKDKPYEHWKDQYTRESRIITTVSTLYSFKATRALYSNFAGRHYFDAACESKFRSIIRPFFLITMFSVLQMGAILIANVYTIWLLRWGYEIVTLSISSIILAVVIFGLEIYEFVLYRNEEPDFMGVGDYFAKQIDPEDKKRLDAKNRERKSLRRSQIKVMSVFDPEGDNDVGIPGMSESDQNYSSIDVNNQSQKQLLGKKIHNSERKVAKDAEERFKFENLPMGRKIKVNEDRINFGEQGQASTLSEMIKKLDQHERILKIRDDLNIIAEKQKAAFDGREIPDSDENSDDQNPQPAVIDQYLDEGIRKSLLVSSQKQKQKVFRDKRQQFEMHRKAAAGPGHSNDLQYHSDIDDKHKVDLTSVNPYRARETKIQPLITNVKVARRPKEKYSDKPDYLNILQDCSDGELERDKLLYDQFYVKFKKEFDEKARNGDLVPNAKLHQSFDEDVLREMYDDFGVNSDYESELSWISYPPKQGFTEEEYFRNNPVKQAENELFKQKIKIKFQYCNMYKESYEAPPKPQLDLKPSVKTQTNAADMVADEVIMDQSSSARVVKTINLDFDPFESEEEFVLEESEQLSAIDEEVYQNLVDKVVYQGFSDVDSDAIGAVETQDNMMHDSFDEVAGPPDGLSKHNFSGENSTQKKRSRGNVKRRANVSKKRKRDDTEQDYTLRKIQTKQEPQATRVGFNGRATQLTAADLEGKLGDVYDTKGHLVYDKDYISQMDDDGVSSLKEGSQHSEGKGRSRLSSGNLKSGKQSKLSIHSQKKSTKALSSKKLSRAASQVDSQGNRKQHSGGDHLSMSSKEERQASSQVGIGGIGANLTGYQANNNASSSGVNLHFSENQNAHDNHPPSHQAHLSDFAPGMIDMDGFSDDGDSNPNKHLSRRERQLIRAYGPNANNFTVEEASQPGQQKRLSQQQAQNNAAFMQHQRKKSNKTAVSRKRKRQHSPQSPYRAATSNRGLSDAHEQLVQDLKQPDNGILQLVISPEVKSNAVTEQQLIEENVSNPDNNTIAASGLTQLKPNEKGSETEFDGNMVDQETRGGNLSSSDAHGGQSSNQNLFHYGTVSHGFNTSFPAGANQSAINKSEAKRDGRTQGLNSGVKAHQLLNGINWESDTSNSMLFNQHQQHQFNRGRRNDDGVASIAGLDQSPPSEPNGVPRTDDEQNRRRATLNNTEIAGAVHGHHNEDDIANNFPNDTQMIANWSDDGGQHQQYVNGRGSHDGPEEGNPFGRLGNSYHPLNRKMTGPQPFMSLGVTTKPYKARRKKKNEQLLADQRRAKFSMGSDRMQKLENIYIKHGLTSMATKAQQHGQQASMLTTNQSLPPRSSVPRADNLTSETMQVFKRHQRHHNYQGQGPEGVGVYKNAQGQRNISSGGPLSRAKRGGPKLHKQNFVEDGQNIINGSSLGMPKVKAQLITQQNQMMSFQQPQQLSNSASEHQELHLQRQQDSQPMSLSQLEHSNSKQQQSQNNINIGLDRKHSEADVYF